ncbi:ABC transporter ATP-binding protein [Amycolatopsis anabasis]|uniref:ABC transporter ATP-binding protein n=1 Tax=Amycolatopsis anabasis TaxID=1840409 RepID=UPI00131BEB11|nr:ABC transporter ATP-binding protein [Amycolatopsis anabasis]
MRITIEALSWAAAGKTIVRDIETEIAPGETVGLIGPNGSGKSTLLRCLAGLRTPTTGTVRYDGHDIHGWSARRIAQQLAFVEQSADSDSDLRVADVVALGRTPFRDRWRGLGHTDRLIVDAALARMELTHLRTRVWKTLSGGERQRTHIARALAQRPWGVLLDEPTNHLDIKHQLELMHLLGNTDQTVIVALHDLSLAARFCDRLLLLHQGALIATGTPQEVLTPDRLREVFEIDAEISHDGLGNLTIAYRGSAPAVQSSS